MAHARSAIVALLGVVLACPLFARQWADSSGVFRLEAELLAVKNEKVYLEKEDGDVIAVPLAALSKDDLRYLVSLPKHRDYFKAHPVAGIEQPDMPKQETAVPPKQDTAIATAQVIPIKEGEPDVGEIRRFGDIRWGITSLAFSPDGRFLAAGKMDRAIMMFDVVEAKRVALVEKLEGLGQVTAVCFTPDGRKLLTGGYSGRIQVWDVDSTGNLTEAQRFVGHVKEVTTITVSSDGSRVLSGGDGRVVRCWTLADAREQFAVDGFSRDLKATFITRGMKQALASDGEVIVLIDMATGEAIQTMKLDKRSAQTVAIAPDGSIVVAHDTHSLHAWEIQSGNGLTPFNDTETQWSAAFLPNSKYLLSGGRGKVNLWDVTTQRKIYEFDTAGSYYVQSIAAAPDNRHFAAIPGSAGQELQVFRLPAEVAAE